MNFKRPAVFLALGAIAVLGISVGAIALFQWFAGENPHWGKVAGPQPSRLAPSREEIEARCKTVISKAEVAAKDAVALRAKQFHDFIAHRQYRLVRDGKIGVEAFAAGLLSMSSKGSLIWSKMPFTDRDGYSKHVAYLFSICLFTTDELGTEFKRAVDDALRDVAAVENQLAVELQEIIVGTSASPGLHTTAPEQFKAAMEKVVAGSTRELGLDVASLAVSELASYVGTQIIVRLGVSAGILTAATANSWWTFGGSIAIGIVADLAWGWIDNPKARIQEDVLRATSKLATDSMNAINGEFANVLQRRAALWQLSANKMIK